MKKKHLPNVERTRKITRESILPGFEVPTNQRPVRNYFKFKLGVHDDVLEVTETTMVAAKEVSVDAVSIISELESISSLNCIELLPTGFGKSLTTFYS